MPRTTIRSEDVTDAQIKTADMQLQLILLMHLICLVGLFLLHS